MGGEASHDDGTGIQAADVEEAQDAPALPWTPRSLTDLRSRRNRRLAALVAAALLGLVAASVHWIGLFVAGALVGLASRTLPRALVGGLAVGVLVLVVHVLGSPVMDVGEFVDLAPAAYVTIGAGLLAPVWGSLVRGVV